MRTHQRQDDMFSKEILLTSATLVRIAGRLLAAVAVLWAGALPLAASLRGVPSGAGALFAFLIYAVGGVICHQRPDRSFHFGATPLPVCARCAGIYAGAAVIALLTLVGYRTRAWSPTKARLWLAAAAAPAVLSLLYEWGTAEIPSNNVRAATGLLIGFAVAAIVLAFVDDEASRASRPAVKR
jgi:uncharacterized membrane protein